MKALKPTGEAPVALRSYRHQLSRRMLPHGQPQLVVEGLSLAFGGVQALSDVSLTVVAGEIHALIGPNGAGKTSLINCITGLYRPTAGIVEFRDKDVSSELTRLSPHQVAELGLARTFQNIELFKHMTALENLMLGRHTHMKHGVFSALTWFGPAQRQEIEQREIVEEVIDLLELQHVRNEHVGALAYGLQKRVELGRALCLHPSLLILDEPMAGMNLEEREDMARYLIDLNEVNGLTILLIDHDMGVVMDLADHITVLDFGKLVASGEPSVIRTHRDVIDVYLGKEHAVA